MFTLFYPVILWGKDNQIPGSIYQSFCQCDRSNGFCCHSICWCLPKLLLLYLKPHFFSFQYGVADDKNNATMNRCIMSEMVIFNRRECIYFSQNFSFVWFFYICCVCIYSASFFSFIYHRIKRGKFRLFHFPAGVQLQSKNYTNVPAHRSKSTESKNHKLVYSKNLNFIKCLLRIVIKK